MMLNDSFTIFHLLTFIFLFSFNIIICQDDYSISKCNDNIDSLINEECFNKVLKFENYKVNNLAINNNRDLIVEFKGYIENNDISSSRKFYGLTKGGQYFFPDESGYIKEFNINIDEETYNGHHDFNLDGSKILFVSIYNR